jgi:hypothetical protein
MLATDHANATIGRALRLVLLNVDGGWPGELDKSTLGHPGKYIPGWGHMFSPVLHSIETAEQPKAPSCVDGACYL